MNPDDTPEVICLKKFVEEEKIKLSTLAADYRIVEIRKTILLYSDLVLDLHTPYSSDDNKFTSYCRTKLADLYKKYTL